MSHVGRLSRASKISGWAVALAVWVLLNAVYVFNMPKYRESWIENIIQPAAVSLVAGPIWLLLAVVQLVARRDRQILISEVILVAAVTLGLGLYVLLLSRGD